MRQRPGTLGSASTILAGQRTAKSAAAWSLLIAELEAVDAASSRPPGLRR